MSGAATFSGTTYQARVIAHIYVHILAQARLGWLELFDDTPIGISAETDGPGDDARIEFGERHRPIEVQAKHGLKAGAKLSDAVARVRERSVNGDSIDVVFVVDRSSSRTVHIEVAKDLERFRVGREDGLRSEFLRLATELGAERDVLRRIIIVTADLDSPKDPETKLTMQLLESVLEDSAQAASAWAVLTADAGDICAKRLRRTRKELVDLLQAASIKVRVPYSDERFSRQLELSKRLLAEGRAAAVLSVLTILDGDLKGKTVDPVILYRLAQHRAAALLAVGKPLDALTSARVALDIQPDGIHALLVAAQAAVAAGDLASAKVYTARVIANEPHNADAWAAKTQIEALAAEAITQPPESVVATETYQMALAQVASNAFDWQRVVDVTATLLARGSRNPKLLQLRASALLGLTEGANSPEAQTHRSDAERLATEAIESLPDDSPLTSTLLVLRAEIRRMRGDAVGSDADLARASELNDRDLDAIAHRVIAQLHAGRPESALQIVQMSAVEEHAMLLALRAQARAETGDADGARSDLDAAAARADQAWRPDSIRILCAETALALHDADRAEHLLDAITADSLAPEMQATLRGRAAFERKEAQMMQRHFRAAAELAPHLKPRLFGELAHRLLRLGETAAAVAVFDEVGVDALHPQLHQHYAGALMETQDFARAAKLAEEVAKSKAAPDWALSIAAEIAARQGDAERAVELLKQVAERRHDDANVQLELARRLLLLNETSAATPYLDLLVGRARTLEPQQRMGLAHLLKEADRDADAVREAFAAFRTAPQDPEIHRGFANLLLTDPPLVTHFGVVEDETYVRLASDDGGTREYVIYQEGPVDPLRNEVTLEDASRMGLTGKRQGDKFVLHGGWQDVTWTIEEVLPAVVYVWRDVVSHFEQRFPSEPFFVHVMKLPDEKSVKYLAPIISTLQARKERAHEVFRMYRENTMPLGFVARMLGGTIPDVMAAATAHDEGPLLVEWHDGEGQAESRAVAREATAVVLTRSALETLQNLELLATVSTAYQWWVPRSLVNALQYEVAQAEKELAEGRRSMMASDTGLRMIEVEAGDPLLVERVQRTHNLRAWVDANAKTQFRPLEKIGEGDPADDRGGSMIGRDSVDAVELAEHHSVAMLADDLGLRRFLPKGSLGRSFSTVALLARLAEREIVSNNYANELLLKLVERRYFAIVPTRALLLHAIRSSRDNAASMARAFALLGGPVLDLSSAAAIAAETIKGVTVTPVQLLDIGGVTRIVLEALAIRWPPTLAAYALLAAGASEFMLLPTAFAEIRRATTAFVQERLQQ